MDAYAVGYLSGSVVVPAFVAFFIARKLNNQSHTTVASAGPPAADANPSAKRQARWHAATPWAVAAGAALFGLASGAASLASEKAEADKDPEKLRLGFVRGCQRACAAKHIESEPCQRLCDCVFAALKRARPATRDLRRLFEAASENDSAAKEELRRAQAGCVPGQQPSN